MKLPHQTSIFIFESVHDIRIFIYCSLASIFVILIIFLLSNIRINSKSVIVTIEIINNTRGGIEGEIWERGNGGQIEIPDERHTILGLHLKTEKFKTRVTKLGVLYVLHVITANIPPKF